jgi:hypothetical protein
MPKLILNHYQKLTFIGLFIAFLGLVFMLVSLGVMPPNFEKLKTNDFKAQKISRESLQLKSRYGPFYSGTETNLALVTLNADNQVYEFRFADTEVNEKALRSLHSGSYAKIWYEKNAFEQVFQIEQDGKKLLMYSEVSELRLASAKSKAAQGFGLFISGVLLFLWTLKIHKSQALQA